MSLKVIETDMDRYATYDFLLMFHSDQGPISHHFKDKRWFQSKISNFSHPMYFSPCWWGSSWNLVLAYSQKK